MLNDYFKTWSTGSSRLPFIYNVVPSAFYSYRPALRQFHKNIKIVHFIGDSKPWRWSRDLFGVVLPRDGLAPEFTEMVQRWWQVYDRYQSLWGTEETRQNLPGHLVLPAPGASSAANLLALVDSQNGGSRQPRDRVSFSREAKELPKLSIWNDRELYQHDRTAYEEKLRSLEQQLSAIRAELNYANLQLEEVRRSTSPGSAAELQNIIDSFKSIEVALEDQRAEMLQASAETSAANTDASKSWQTYPKSSMKKSPSAPKE